MRKQEAQRLKPKLILLLPADTPAVHAIYRNVHIEAWAVDNVHIKAWTILFYPTVSKLSFFSLYILKFRGAA